MLTTAQARSIVCSLAIGAVGGVLFHALRVPLAWMLGPMCFNILAALLRLPVNTPQALRNGLLPVLGVYLGSSFTPETVERAGQWPWSLAGVMVFVFLCTGLVAWYYHRVAGFDRVTALFSAGPGALTAMILTGAALGGDERRIALAQSLRLTLLVLVLPPLIFALSSQPPRSATLEVAARAFDLRQLALLAVSCALSVLLFKRLHVPTPQLAGPMLASAVLYLSGLVALDLPHWLLEATLWILGSAVGARFVGVDAAALWTMTRAALGAVALSLLLAFAFAAALAAALTEVDFLPALLALAPGGVAEMCLVAVALDIDPSFVAFHHLSRMLLLMAVTPWVGRWVEARG